MPASPASRKPISTCRAIAALLRHLQALLRVALHRSRHLLSRGQGLRSFQDRALDRRAAHGALRPRARPASCSPSIPKRGFRDAVLINAAYGLGENVVQGSVNPDEYYVFKPTLKTGLPADPAKDARAARNSSWSTTSVAARWSRTCRCRRRTARRFAIGDDEILQLARWACLIEDHYSAKRGQPVPMDMEWAKDGQHRRAVHRAGAARDRAVAQRSSTRLETYRLKQRGTVLVTGRSVGEKIASGPVRVIKSVGIPAAVSARAKCSSPTRPIPTGSRS